MSKLAKLQLIGPVVLALAIVAAELAACFLAWKPSSAFAWYVNLELFGIFQRGHSVLGSNFNAPYLQLWLVAVPMLFLSLGGFALRSRLPIALASNLSFAYAFFLTYSWYGTRLPAPQSASLASEAYDTAFSFSALNLTFGPHVFVLAVLLIPSLLSTTCSHLVYVRAVRGV